CYTERKNVLRSIVGAAAVEAGFRTDEGDVDARCVQRVGIGRIRITRVAVQIHDAGVVLELAVLGVAPGNNTGFTAKLLRSAGSDVGAGEEHAGVVPRAHEPGTAEVGAVTWRQ